MIQYTQNGEDCDGKVFPYLSPTVMLHNDRAYPEKDIHIMNAQPARCQSRGSRHVSSMLAGLARTMGRMRTKVGHARCRGMLDTIT